MKSFVTLQLTIKKEKKCVFFGIPDTPEELERIFKLRFEVYKTHNYINSHNTPTNSEKDEYDKSGKCLYFIAKIDKDIIGSVRTIRDEILPIQKDCFTFSEPPLIKKLDKNHKAEIGRLVIKRSPTYDLPRNIILLFLIYTLVAYGEIRGIIGGYAFIKETLQKKLKRLKIPLHYIKKYQQKYPSDGLLAPYFNDKENPVLPTYFFTEEIKNRLTEIVNSNLFRKEQGKYNYFILRHNLYTRFLKKMHIL